MSPPRIMVICTGNSCRSQMAEGWLNHLAPDRVLVTSAGSDPSGYVHPLAIEAMQEAGIDIQHAQSKPLGNFLDQEFDYVITVCDHAAKACPVFPGPGARIHWPFEDPAKVVGTEDEVKAAFRNTRELIRKRIEEFLSEELDIH